jgi:DNA repair protein RadC
LAPFEVPVRIDCVRAARHLFAECFARTDLTRETLWVAHVNAARRCVHLSRYQGNKSSAPFPLKSILKDALEHDSSGILLAHNHPSGNHTPSTNDYHVTLELASAAKAVDCAVLDHLILGGGEWCSFREAGLL